MPLKVVIYTGIALGLSGLGLYRKHLVSALLCLEGLMVTLFIILTILIQALNTTTAAPQPIILLTLSACEAGAGLALLVASSRTHASDLLKTLNLLAC